MNVSKQVFNALFKEEKTNLETHKINLSVVDDIDKLSSKARAYMLDGSSLAQKAIKAYNDAAQAYAEGEGIANSSIPKAQDLGAKSLVKELKSKVSNIGKDLKRANNVASKIKSLI